MSNLPLFKQFLIELKIKQTKLAYHDQLNPQLWDDKNKLNPKVLNQLRKISNLFIDTLNIDKQYVTDVCFTGSSVNYNYSDLSDIDLHIAIDFKKLKGKINPEDYFNSMKSNWNLTHEIKIYGHDVELYVNDKKENLVQDAAAYSITKGEWIKEPKKEVPQYSDRMIKIKSNHLALEIDKQIKMHHNDKEILENLSDKINKMRRAGLSKHGEFSLENLVFKSLRNNGYVTRLRNQITKAEDNKLNLESKKGII